VEPSISKVISSNELYCCWLLSHYFNAPNYHPSLVLASVVQGHAVNCNNTLKDSEFATGYGYPKTAFKREPVMDKDIQNAFLDISRIRTVGESCTLNNHSFSILGSIFSAFCAMTPSPSMV